MSAVRCASSVLSPLQIVERGPRPDLSLHLPLHFIEAHVSPRDGLRTKCPPHTGVRTIPDFQARVLPRGDVTDIPLRPRHCRCKCYVMPSNPVSSDTPPEDVRPGTCAERVRNALVLDPLQVDAARPMLLLRLVFTVVHAWKTRRKNENGRKWRDTQAAEVEDDGIKWGSHNAWKA